jgi:hypothetical protein
MGFSDARRTERPEGLDSEHHPSGISFIRRQTCSLRRTKSSQAASRRLQDAFRQAASESHLTLVI